MRRAFALVFLAIAVHCAKPAPPPHPAQQTPRRGRVRRFDEKPPDDSADRLSIMTLSRGATVIERTGEMFLETSAIRAIDGDPMSFWMGPPHDLPQSLTVALPARSRIEKIGIRTDETFPAKHVSFERSIDGISFAPLSTITAAETLDPQWFDVPPAEATHVRVTIVDRAIPDRESRLRSILVRGIELEPPHPGDIGGCWSFNGSDARFDRRNASVAGTVQVANQPMQLDGGFDGRIYRFNWVRGNDFGYLLLSVSPDGRHVNAIEWHEEPIPLFYGNSWFGDRRPCDALSIRTDTREAFLRRAGRYSLYGLRFLDDGTLDRDQSADVVHWLAGLAAENPIQLIAHEFRRPNPNANREFAKRELDSLRDELKGIGAKVDNVTFAARGSDMPRQNAETEAMRALYSTIDVEIRR